MEEVRWRSPAATMSSGSLVSSTASSSGRISSSIVIFSSVTKTRGCASVLVPACSHPASGSGVSAVGGGSLEQPRRRRGAPSGPASALGAWSRPGLAGAP
eukprot:scaffold34812_cov57-Phaeocystis_antarctica.AAC.1